jgi:hypothetical protein
MLSYRVQGPCHLHIELTVHLVSNPKRHKHKPSQPRVTRCTENTFYIAD